MKPYLKYAGGKSHLAPLIKLFWEYSESKRLVEPFAGSLAVTLALDPCYALVNDNNEHVMNLHHHVQNWLVIEQKFENDESYFYQARRRFNELTKGGKSSSKEAAELYFYMNRNGFNGLSRFNKKGEFNVPFGRYKNVNYQKEFSSYSISMQDWEIECGDFEQLDIRDNDFLFVDPPYDDAFTQYGKEGFDWGDQERLVNWLNNYNCPIITTNLATYRIIELYCDNGFDVYTYSARRRISANGSRTPVMEMFAIKNIQIPHVLLGGSSIKLTKAKIAEAA